MFGARVHGFEVLWVVFWVYKLPRFSPSSGEADGPLIRRRLETPTLCYRTFYRSPRCHRIAHFCKLAMSKSCIQQSNGLVIEEESFRLTLRTKLESQTLDEFLSYVQQHGYWLTLLIEQYVEIVYPLNLFLLWHNISGLQIHQTIVQ